MPVGLLGCVLSVALEYRIILCHLKMHSYIFLITFLVK